jgi:hypothetical protein
MQGFVVKTSDLDSQFNIGKNTRISRLAMVGLLPENLYKDGKYYWLTQEQYDLFCDFDSYIRATGGTKDYPKLYKNYSEAITEKIEADDEFGELATVGNQKIATGSHRDLNATTFIGEFPGYTSGYIPGDKLAQQLKENAQNRAAAMLMAESVLADRYLQNPDALPVELRAQIDSIPLRKVDPKEYAALLIRGVED